MSDDCRMIQELFPWHLLRSLDDEDERRVRQHLESCESCRLELQDTLLAAHTFDAHIPSPRMTAFVEDALETDDRQAALSHLAECNECSELIELTRRSLRRSQMARVEMPAPRSSVSPIWRRWAVAASVATLMVMAGWLADRTFTRAPLPPQINLGVYDVFGTALDLRSDEAEENLLTLTPAAEQVLLILHSPQAAEGSEYSLVILDAQGRESWKGTGLTAQAGGNFTVSLPVSLLPPGRLTLRLESSDGRKESFLVRIETSPAK